MTEPKCYRYLYYIYKAFSGKHAIDIFIYNFKMILDSKEPRISIRERIIYAKVWRKLLIK